MSEPEPVLDERGRIDAATSVEAIIAKGWMRFPHDPPHPDSFALADAAITAYQSATGDALTEAEHRADLAERRNLLNPQSTEYVQELEHRAERAEKVVEAARECVTECDYGDEAKTVIPRRWCLTHQDWSPCAHAGLAAALAALDTTDGPGKGGDG